MTSVRLATIDDVDALSPLFNGYRVFYKQVSNIDAARAFLIDRLNNKESVIFIAEANGKIQGFTQLYPTFSSVSLERFFILNDLFVIPEARGQGIGKAILNHCQKWAEKHQLKGLALETASDNPAQALYEREGWSKDEGFYHYFWTRSK